MSFRLIENTHFLQYEIPAAKITLRNQLCTVSHFKKDAAHADSKVMYAHFHTELAELTVV